MPSSFKYSSAAMDHAARKPSRRSSPTPPYPERKRSAATLHSVSPRRNNTDPVIIPLSSAPNVATPKHTESESNHNMATKRSATVNISRRKPSTHDPNALPPAVAALLAVTAIPPRRPNRYRTHAGSGRRISIEELISEWRNDDSLKQSYESPTSGALGILLEDGLDADDDNSVPSYLNARSASSDSMPSLDSDNQSVLSVGSPSTPGSLRSRKSITNFKKEKPRSLPASVDCALDHPLITTLEIEGDDDLPPLPKQKRVVAKSKSSFKSNLTASLQSLKEAAVNSISDGRVECLHFPERQLLRWTICSGLTRSFSRDLVPKFDLLTMGHQRKLTDDISIPCLSHSRSKKHLFRRLYMLRSSRRLSTMRRLSRCRLTTADGSVQASAQHRIPVQRLEGLSSAKSADDSVK